MSCPKEHYPVLSANYKDEWPRSFAEAMGDRPLRYGLWSPNDKDWLLTLQKSYEAFLRVREPLVNAASSSENGRIPKIIHHIWLGSELPAKYARYVQSWRTHHSEDEWTHHMWTDEKVAGMKLKNAEAYKAAKNFGEKSDILRYEILSEYGGIYVDTDFECLRPLDELLNERISFLTGISNTGTVELNNGFIASAPGHPILADLVSRINVCKKTKATPAPPPSPLDSIFKDMLGEAESTKIMQALAPQKLSPAMETIERTGPGLFTRTFLQHLQKEGEGSHSAIALPSLFFYPVPNNASFNGDEEGSEPEKHFLKEFSYAVHLWAKSWQ